MRPKAPIFWKTRKCQTSRCIQKKAHSTIPTLSLLLYSFNFYSQILSSPFNQEFPNPFSKKHTKCSLKAWMKAQSSGSNRYILFILYSLFFSLLPFLSVSNYGSISNLLFSLSSWFYDFFSSFEFWVFRDQI